MFLTIFAIVPPVLGMLEVFKRDALASFNPSDENHDTFRGRLAVMGRRWGIGFVELIKKIIMVTVITIMSSGNVAHLSGGLEHFV